MTTNIILNNRKKIISITIITFLSLVMMGCTNNTETEGTDETTDITIETEETTEENELVGTWTLKSQIMQAPQGSIPSKFSGRTLTFNADGTYSEDYSTEKAPTQTINTPDVTINNDCKSTGSSYGLYSVKNEADLDTTPPTFIDLLFITPEGGEKPQIICENSLGTSNTQKLSSTMPLGAGPSTVEGVKYTYTINNDASVLTLVQHNTITNVSINYTFTK